jgi:hypothetical protein
MGVRQLRGLALDECLERSKKFLPSLKMIGQAVWPYQDESLAVSGTIAYTSIGKALRNLPLTEADDRRFIPIDFVFPAYDFGRGEPAPQGGDNLRGGNEFGQQRALARRNFAGFNFG